MPGSWRLSTAHHRGSRFDWLREPDPDAVASPHLLVAFDLLNQDGRRLSARPLRDRRVRLEDLVAGSVWSSRCADWRPEALEAWAQVIECEYYLLSGLMECAHCGKRF
jgi:hypothetical protein